MHAIAGAEYVATGNTFVALHQIKTLLLPAMPGRMGETAFTGDPPPFHWVANMHMPIRAGFTRPLAGNDVQLQLMVIQRFQRPGNKAFRATIGPVFLAP